MNKIKMIEICVASRNISPFVSAVKAQLITEYWSHFSWCFEIYQWDWDPIWPNINLLYFRILFLYLLTLWCDAGLWTTFIYFLRLNFYFDIDTSTKNVHRHRISSKSLLYILYTLYNMRFQNNNNHNLPYMKHTRIYFS